VIAALALKSLRNRRGTAALTVIAIALAVSLLIGVERIREQSRESFASTIAGTDLIVGARSSPVHLLLASVFRIGDATSNVGWTSYRTLAGRPEVEWTIPLSLGDSHRGFRVVGTTSDYFEHMHFAGERKLSFASGHRFERAHDAVLGHEVAMALGYGIGQSVVIAHGSGDVAFTLHEDQPFRVVGVLERTGTPVDRAIHVPLEGMDAVHADIRGMPPDPLAAAVQAARARRDARDGSAPRASGHDGLVQDDSARTITAFLVGLKSRRDALSLQRLINQFPGEPLTAILPGVTLLEVWGIVGIAERALLAVSILVVVVGLAGMLVALLTSLSERRREMAVLRSVGARPMQIFALILGEAMLLTTLGIAVGVAMVYCGLVVGRPWLESQFGLFMDIRGPSPYEWGLAASTAVAGALIGMIPAYRVYRYSLADGMVIRV